MRVGHDTKRTPATTSGLLRRPLVALVALATVGVLAAGCGSSNSGSGSGSGGGVYGGGTAPSTGPSGVATVSAASTRLGTILVDGSGRTLYLFEKDQPNQSACGGACAAAWPVDQSSGTPKAGSGVTASLLGTIRRGDGTTQVAYNGHPLYYFPGDSGPGQHNGQGMEAFGAKWFVVDPAGAAAPVPDPDRAGGRSAGRATPSVGHWHDPLSCRGRCGSVRPPPWGWTRSCTGRTHRPTTPSGRPSPRGRCSEPRPSWRSPQDCWSCSGPGPAVG